MTDRLDPDEQRAWQAMIALMTEMPLALDNRLHRDCGLTHFEFRVLSALSEKVGHRQRLGELAHTTNASPSRLSHVIAKLEHLGYATRETTTGQPGVYAVLTDIGFATVVEATPSYVDTVRRLVFDGLDADQVSRLADFGETISERLARSLTDDEQDAVGDVGAEAYNTDDLVGKLDENTTTAAAETRT